MYKTEAIKQFLKYTVCPVAKRYTPDMETQVNVLIDVGVKITGEFKGKRWRGWKNPQTGETWKNFRIPWNADSKPEYTDSKISWSLYKYVEGVGMTGWDWKNKQSLWVGYDFDSIVNHAGGISNVALDDLVEKTKEISWVNLLRSTSGTGYHLYLFFDKPVATQTHIEHAALARSLISLLTAETGYNFRTNVDCVGSILWVYHRKQEGTRGFTWKKKGTDFPTAKVPNNWREHILVTSYKSKRIRKPKSFDLNSLSNYYQETYLQKDHHKILKWFGSKSQHDWWWDTDYQMLVCHTRDLESCYNQLNLKGYFKTVSQGKNLEQNCFCFPDTDGSFVVRRFGSRTKEDKSWRTDESGWTTCDFNKELIFENAIAITEGLENSQGYTVYHGTKKVIETLELLDIRNIPKFTKDMENSPVVLKKKGDKLLIKVLNKSIEVPPPGFVLERGGYVTAVVQVLKEKTKVEIYDNLIRATISGDKDAGWYAKVDGQWVFQSKPNILSILSTQVKGKKADLDSILGHSLLKPYVLVNKPFEEEYIGGRMWNKNAAQLSVTPKEGVMDTWWNLFDHIGYGLDSLVLTDPWCIDNGITTGGEYIFAWCSSLFQYPERPLPYLFLFGGQNTGKSTLHEALSLLFVNKRGYSRVDHALKDKNGFNHELANAVLAVIEEVDLSHDKTASNRVKDWVTGDTVSIREMYRNTVDIQNTLHFIHCSNDLDACPVYPEDTRITICQVYELKKEIPKSILMQTLKSEIQAVLFEFLNYSLPDPRGRLNVPILETEEKKYLMGENASPLIEFISDRGSVVEGEYEDMSTVAEEFLIWLESKYPLEAKKWSKRKFKVHFPIKGIIVKGNYGGRGVIGNFKLDYKNKENVKPTHRFVMQSKGRLIRKELK